MQRKVLGVLAILSLVSGLVLLWWSGYHFSGGAAETIHEGGMYAGSMLLRVGIALGAVWLAIPSRTDQINWSQVLVRAGAIVLGVLLISRLKAALLLRFLPLLAGIGFLIYLLRPKRKGRRTQH